MQILVAFLPPASLVMQTTAAVFEAPYFSQAVATNSRILCLIEMPPQLC